MEGLPVSPTLEWLQQILNDPHITDICINGAHSVFIDRGQSLEPWRVDSQVQTTELDLKTWILDQLSAIGKTWDARFPFIDASIPSGHRMHVVFPPLSQTGLLISLRKLPSRGCIRWNHSPFYNRLKAAIQQGDSILISGATGSGKTTLANDLLGEVSTDERIIALEDTPELAPSHPHFLSLMSRPANAEGFGEVTLRSLLKQTLRMRPDRIILGECRGSEVLELLQALNTGHRGALATLHANSPRDALRRIELLCILASEGRLPIRGIRELLSLGIQWIVQTKRVESERIISEVVKLESMEGDTILLRPVVHSFDHDH
jgi:pilus assembly protein CpaF